MKLQPVQSSNVQAIGYDPAKHVMHVQFRGGATYAHEGVSPDQHQAFMDSPSKGKHYHATFKDKFGVKKVKTK